MMFFLKFPNKIIDKIFISNIEELKNNLRKKK